MQRRCILLFTETFSFRPLQQGKTHYQLPGMASADRADNEFWMRNVARNEPLKIFMKPSKNQQRNKQTNKKYSEITHKTD